jgi:hypothetical protein
MKWRTTYKSESDINNTNLIMMGKDKNKLIIITQEFVKTMILLKSFRSNFIKILLRNMNIKYIV